MNPGTTWEEALIELPQDEFAAIIGQLNLKFSESRADKRAAPRIPIGRKASLLRDTNTSDKKNPNPRAKSKRPPTPSTLIRELSLGGVGLLHSEPMRPGEHFILLLPRAVGGALPVQCTVLRCQSCGSNTTFSIGACFVAILSKADITPQAIEIRRIRQAILAG